MAFLSGILQWCSLSAIITLKLLLFGGEAGNLSYFNPIILKNSSGEFGK